ncbi:hypothetical protein [Schauerella aestuarii]|uniref:hypothetical protein n=1 Tax=Schauerella aestuarii TaxID=2511204 RepID=UPI001369E597|nr:hypothetical protein [Achromobacter aestuarii]MYZ41802.1 hypothetical protein [Achromobacter aestuarii]
MISMLSHTTLGNAMRRSAWRAVLTVTMACVSLAGCGGDDDDATVADAGPAATEPASSAPAPPVALPETATSPTSDGISASQIPIVAAPATGTCGESGTAVEPDRVLNSTLDCAP